VVRGLHARWRSPPASPAQARARARSDVGRIAVEDNGPGIAPEKLPRVFEPFFTTKPVEEGPGLGLSVARDYIERCGGAIAFENRAPRGARVSFDLPLAASSTAA